MLVDDFDYVLPPQAIAQEAIEPRDASRLLDTRMMEDRVFSDLPSMLNRGDLVVVNRTRVRAARLVGTRETGGRTELLLTRRVDRDRWQALINPAKKVRTGSKITIGDIEATVLSDPADGVATITLQTEGDIEDAIATHGAIPLPPYFHGSLAHPDRYQTIFADTVGSSAAPTAALHFTPSVVAGLHERGVEMTVVDLNVGLDTFRPMSDGRVEDHRIHSERIVVGQEAVDAIDRTRRRGGRVVAIGTTVVRTLESAAKSDRTVARYDGDTDLFITEGYVPQVVDAVVTNFHAPRTTLLVLISALIGERWKDVYEHALTSGYRFLSFGDAMYLEIER
jgi:S-adenosylmethionine:tRNA ribosyltransferase-isomerase